MAKCRDCGEEIIFVRRGGKLVPCDPEPPLHFRNRKHIEATRKNRSPVSRRSPPVDRELVAVLRAAVGWLERDAVAFVKEHPDVTEAELIKAALAAQAESMKKRGKLG